MKRMRRTHDGGFTLVELMLSVLLLAIIMAIVYGVVVSTVEAAQRVEEINQSSEIGPALLAQIREDLESAFLPGKEGEFFVSISRKGSTGDRDRVDFIGARMAYGARKDGEDPAFHSVNELGYQVADNPKDPSVGILYRREDYFIDNEPLRGGRLVEMYDRVRHFHLEYYNGDQWIPDWNSKREKNTLPRAVRIELKIMVTERDQQLERVFTSIVTFAR
jgi:prepilin-type N-terminal cleavage/methylation domain-containing protein